MATKDPSRESHFPAIEKKHGEPIKNWLKLLKDLSSTKYPEQIAFLRENYGFSQAHANALVMYSKGSISTRKFENTTEFYKSIDPKQAKTIRAMFKIILEKYPELEQVIAWNQPMLRIGTMYIFGVSTTKNYLLIAPWSTDVIDRFRPKLTAYRVNKKTIAVPSDWQVDTGLLLAMVKARLAER